MASAQHKRKAFHDLLAAPGCEIVPSAYDALGAKLVERAGFRAVHMSGSGVHKSYGFTDVGLLTLTEQVARATALADAVGIPVIGDCETGHGNVVNAVRAVREFERSGVAAIHIEDQVTPKRPGADGLEKAFVSTSEFVGKIKAAVDTRSDPSFAIVARIDARAAEPYERVVERGLAAAEAGADAVWISLEDPEEMREITRTVPKPMIGVPRRPRITPKLYGEMGYKLALIPGTLGQAACWGMAGALRALRETGSEAEFLASLPGFDEIRAWFQSVGVAETRDLEDRYLR